MRSMFLNKSSDQLCLQFVVYNEGYITTTFVMNMNSKQQAYIKTNKKDIILFIPSLPI